MRQPILLGLLLSALGVIPFTSCSQAEARPSTEADIPRDANLEETIPDQEEQRKNYDPRARVSRDDRPRVCSNRELSAVFKIISRACTRHECDISKLGELDSDIERVQLLGTLRNPDLRPIHLFFPSNEDSVDGIFDWNSQKKSQLDAIRFAVSSPEETVVFVLGKASRTGTISHNRELSRDRSRSVIRYIKSSLDLPFHHIHGAWVGREVLQFSDSDARTLNLEPQDYRKDDLVLNQAVHVFLYPCAKPMAGEQDH